MACSSLKILIRFYENRHLRYFVIRKAMKKERTKRSVPQMFIELAIGCITRDAIGLFEDIRIRA